MTETTHIHRFSYDLDRLSDAAAFILEHARHPVMLFHAPMGAGKTTLIKEILKHLTPQEFSGSPTFGLVNEYTARDGRPVYHFDLYRLKQPEELLDLGFDEYLDRSAYVFIEWPDKAADYMPDTYSLIEIIPEGTFRRTIQIRNT